MLKKKIIVFISGFATILLLDFLWLGILMKGFYASQLEGMARQDFLIAPAIAVWILITLGLYIFAVPKKSFLIGSIFGFVAYGIYDLTNYAVLQGWTLEMTLVDMAWGAFLCGAATFAMNKAGSFFHEKKTKH